MRVLMQSIVTQFIEEKQLLTKHATVLIGVSGGPDSMALLYYYYSIRENWDLNLIVVSVDHQLRGADSEEDIIYVKEMCEKWHVKFVADTVDVKAYKQRNKVGTQVAARELRYQSFAKQMDIHKADYLALGHHGDDQVETMLMAFSRTASPIALSGIPMTRSFHGGSIVRPFLCVTKSDIKQYCAQHEIIPRIDQSNKDVNYTRNYFRQHIIPPIKERNNKLHITVQRLSESLQEDERFLQDQAYEVFCKVIDLEKEYKRATFKINQFKSNPHALQRRVYHLILDYLYHQLPANLSYAHEEIFFALLKDDQGNAVIDFPDHLQVERSYGTLFFSFGDLTTPSNEPYEQILQIPGKIHLPNQAELTTKYTNEPPMQDQYTLVCAAESVSLPLSVRTRRPGDRMSWQGLSGTKKIKDVFIDGKVPRKERDTWPIIVDGDGKIIWLVGIRKDKQTLPIKGEPLYIVLKYEEESI